MSALIIIPARGGSKRIPRKNIRPFLGRPILAHVIQSALESGTSDTVMVSTDDPEIAGIAKEAGAEVPFMRSAENSNDYAVTLAVIREVLEKYRNLGGEFQYCCCLYATAVLTRPESLRQGKEQLLREATLDGVLPVVRFDYPIQRAVRLDGQRIRMFQPEHCLMRTSGLIRPDFQLLGPSCAPVVIDSCEVQDIDNEEDWKMAELKFQLRPRCAM
jgi:N-acylneuraminate cytidylyltransferase